MVFALAHRYVAKGWTAAERLLLKVNVSHAGLDVSEITAFAPDGLLG